MRMYAYNKKYYMGVINMHEDRMKGMQSSGVVRVVMVNADNADARKIWELAMPIQHHIKSYNKYKDMEII